MPRSIGMVGPHVLADVEQQRAEAAAVQQETRRSDDWRDLAFAYRKVLIDFTQGKFTPLVAQLKASLLDKQMDGMTK